MDNDVQKLWESYNNINDTDIIKILDNEIYKVFNKIKGTSIDDENYFDRIADMMLRNSSLRNLSIDQIVDRMKYWKQTNKLDEFLAPLGAAGTTANAGPLLTVKSKKRRSN